MDQGGNLNSEKNLHSVAPPRHKWTLTQESFDKLLAILDSDRESAGGKYQELRGSLLRFFEWRGCPFPEEHTDETINRVAKRVSEGEEILNPNGYFHGAARMVLLEIRKEQAKERQALSELAHPYTKPYEFGEPEPRVECLERCLAGLSGENRDLILQYYQGTKGAKIKNRKRLTERFKIPINTLRMRALRLREKLQVCVEECLHK